MLRNSAVFCEKPPAESLSVGSKADLLQGGSLAELHLRAVRTTAELLWRAEASDTDTSDHKISKVHLWFSFLSSNVLRITWFLSY